MINILSVLVAGIFSCIILDILGYLLKKIGIPEPSWGIVGRWTYYMIKNGIFFNPTIIEKPEFKYEVSLGWVFITLYQYLGQLFTILSLFLLELKCLIFQGLFLEQ